MAQHHYNLLVSGPYMLQACVRACVRAHSCLFTVIAVSKLYSGSIEPGNASLNSDSDSEL